MGSALTSSWTRMRDEAQQHWPMLTKRPMWHATAACSRSASFMMIIADLPPSSSVTFLRLDSPAATTCKQRERAWGAR